MSEPSNIVLRQARIQQRRAAEKIESIFAAGRIHYCFLNADVQSGKTGCFQTVIRNMLEKGMVDRAYILCGSTETELYEQAKADTMAYNADFADNITVIFRQDFPKHELIVKRSLIVVDESHMDQNVPQKLAQYLAKYGLAMDGTRPEMLANKTYILSVDATGYSEVSAIRQGLSRSKAIVDLETGDGYWGPADYYYESFYRPEGQKLLQATFDIQDGAGKERFISLFQSATWNLMRIPGGKREQKTATISYIRDLCQERDIDVYLFNSTHEEVQIACPICETAAQNDREPPAHRHEKPTLSALPTRPSLVLLDGRLRAGKVVPKRHVGFVWEGAKVSNTDAVVQGLLGRMCGYAFGASKPLIFVPEATLKQQKKKEISWCEIERHIRAHPAKDRMIFWEDTDEPLAIPTKATNIIPGKNPKRLADDKHRCPPLRFHLGEDAEWAEEPRDAVLKAICLDALRRPENVERISAHPNLSADQKTEILEGIRTIQHPETETSVRNIRRTSADSQHQYLAALVAAHRDGVMPTCQTISDIKLLNFVIVHPDNRLPGLRAAVKS